MKAIKIIKKIIFTILIIILGYSVIGNISGINSGLFDFLHFGNFVVLTGSMEPSISPGDYITVTKVDVNDLEVGDVVTYRFNGSTVTHKIIEIGKETVTTQGTANNVADDPISKEAIIGKYLFKIPKMGYIMSFLSSTAGLILIVGFVGIVIFWEVTDPNKNKKVVNNTDNNTYIDDPEYLEYLAFKKQREKTIKEESVTNETSVKDEVKDIEKHVDEKQPSKRVLEVKLINKEPKVIVPKDNEVSSEDNIIVDREEDSIDPWNVSGSRSTRSKRNKK